MISMMRKIFSALLAALLLTLPLVIDHAPLQAASKPWNHGRLQVSDNHRYLQHADGTPFFWQGETGWLLPERLNRDEAEYYLSQCSANGYNVVQVQTINGVPAYNVYGQSSHPNGYDFSTIDAQGYGYWQHMDYIIRTAEQKGIYIGMVCIWGGLVKRGMMTVEQARQYGTFLANRYKDAPNIVWIIGGDIQGSVKTEEWVTLAETIRGIDHNHLMTYHPRGRTSSATWFNDAEWLDFNMFQSGHRRYGQRNGDGDYTIAEDTEEDNWRYVESALSLKNIKPILDGEPSYERIPQGLHDVTQPQWTAADCRRYAWWSVLAGSCGHTYGNNALMQFYKPGTGGAYGCTTPWYEAVNDPGFRQMHHVKDLMLRLPYFDRIPDQSVLVGTYGERYERPVASRGKDYIVVYTYTGAPLTIDLTKISGAKKHAWWYSPSDGTLSDLGECANAKSQTFQTGKSYGAGRDYVLVIVDASKDYLK